MQKRLNVLSIVTLLVCIVGAISATQRTAQADIFGTDCPDIATVVPKPVPYCDDDSWHSVPSYICRMSTMGKCCTYKKSKEFCPSTGALMQTEYFLMGAGQANMHCVDNGDGTSHCQSN